MTFWGWLDLVVHRFGEYLLGIGRHRRREHSHRNGCPLIATCSQPGSILAYLRCELTHVWCVGCRLVVEANIIIIPLVFRLTLHQKGDFDGARC